MTDSMITIHAEALGPILNASVPPNGGEDDKNTQKPVNPAQLRVMIRNDNDELIPVSIGVVTGNSVSGGVRRMILTDLLKRLGLTREAVAQAINANPNREAPRILYHTLYSGGTLGVLTSVIPEFDLAIEQQLRAEWPMFSLLGCSAGASMLRSHVAWHPLAPASTQLEFMFPAEVRRLLKDFDPRDTLVVTEDGGGSDPAVEVAFSRHVDLSVPLPAAHNKKGELYYRPMVQPRKGYIAPGTPLLGWVNPLVELPEVEAALLSHGLTLWAHRGQLGGWGHVGFGASAIRVTGLSDTEPYLAWVAENQERLVNELTGQTLPFWIRG